MHVSLIKPIFVHCVYFKIIAIGLGIKCADIESELIDLRKRCVRNDKRNLKSKYQEIIQSFEYIKTFNF